MSRLGSSCRARLLSGYSLGESSRQFRWEAGQPFDLTLGSQVGVVLLCGLLGLIDVRMRGERFLWANLGVRPAWLFTTYAALAISAELALWVVL